MVLSKMKKLEQYLGSNVTDAVITVPVILTTHKTSNKRCWNNCWIKCFKIINEPTAAAIAYGLKKQKLILKKMFLFLIWVVVLLMFLF